VKSLRFGGEASWQLVLTILAVKTVIVASAITCYVAALAGVCTSVRGESFNIERVKAWQELRKKVCEILY
jgi:hypothetical protein